jgi:hypothetical protein
VSISGFGNTSATISIYSSSDSSNLLRELGVQISVASLCCLLMSLVL